MKFLGITKPSEAAQAMVDGLRAQSKRSDFRIAMDTFGSTDGKICFGCAATCAIQVLNKRNFTVEDLCNGGISRRQAIPAEKSAKIARFESAINLFRIGIPIELFDFFEIDYPAFTRNQNWHLNDDNWEKQLPKVESYIQKLKSRNL